MSKFATFSRLSSERKALIREAVFQLCRAWFLVRFRQFGQWSKTLGKKVPGDYRDNSIEAPDIVDEIVWTIDAINRLFHRKFTCLMEAMAGKEMLRKRGISNGLILGATLGNPTEPQTMLAHAWLRIGTKIVLGAEEVVKYKAIVSYCDLKEP